MLNKIQVALNNYLNAQTDFNVNYFDNKKSIADRLENLDQFVNNPTIPKSEELQTVLPLGFWNQFVICIYNALGWKDLAAQKVAEVVKQHFNRGDFHICYECCRRNPEIFCTGVSFEENGPHISIPLDALLVPSLKRYAQEKHETHFHYQGKRYPVDLLGPVLTPGYLVNSGRF